MQTLTRLLIWLWVAVKLLAFMVGLGYIIIVICNALVLGAEELPTPFVLGREHPVIVRSVYDGDTFTLDIDLDFGFWLKGETVRAMGYDAWEVTRTRKTVGEITDQEIAKGKEARTYVENLFRNAKVVTCESSVIINQDFDGTTLARRYRDPYGRLLLFIRVDGKLLAKLMEERGYVRK